jgi:outer membrane protein
MSRTYDMTMGWTSRRAHGRFARSGVRWAILATALVSGGARATTLQQALVSAYTGNPTLTGDRAALRSVDENAAIARAEGRPQISVNANAVQGLTGLRDVNGYNRAILAGGTVQMPLFQGGRVRNQIRSADARAEAGRSELLGVEGDTLSSAVAAYVDVQRDRAIVDLNTHNIAVLGADRDAGATRFREGDLTRTDVDQSEARLQAGNAQLEHARAQLTASEENYRAVIGAAPDALDPPPPLPPLPDSVAEAERIAFTGNPDIEAARGSTQSARYDVGTARAARLPTVSLSGTSNYFNYLDRFAGIGNTSGISAQVEATLSLPLYQGGQTGAQVRHAQDLVAQAMEQEVAAERQVVQKVRTAFSDYRSSLREIDAQQAAVAANTRALTGVREEDKGGLRQLLDVLNAEQELLNSQVALATARGDAYTAGFQLLNAMGMVSYKTLGLEGGAFYDPMLNYRRAIHSRGDFTDGPAPHPVSRSTYGPSTPDGGG